MRTENSWREFRFWYSASLTTSPDILDKLYRWIAKPDNLDLKSEKFATFMSRVVGKFTRAYLQEIPERVNDR